MGGRYLEAGVGNAFTVLKLWGSQAWADRFPRLPIVAMKTTVTTTVMAAMVGVRHRTISSTANDDRNANSDSRTKNPKKSRKKDSETETGRFVVKSGPYAYLRWSNKIRRSIPNNPSRSRRCGCSFSITSTVPRHASSSTLRHTRRRFKRDWPSRRRRRDTFFLFFYIGLSVGICKLYGLSCLPQVASRHQRLLHRRCIF